MLRKKTHIIIVNFGYIGEKLEQFLIEALIRQPFPALSAEPEGAASCGVASSVFYNIGKEGRMGMIMQCIF